MSKINFKDAGGFDPIPGGLYPATVAKATYIAKSKTSGEPYIKFEFTVTADGFENRKLWKNSSLQVNALWATKKALIAMGIDPDILESMEDTDELKEELPNTVGASVTLKVSVGEYNGKPKNDVDDVLEADSYNFS